MKFARRRGLAPMGRRGSGWPRMAVGAVAGAMSLLVTMAAPAAVATASSTVPGPEWGVSQEHPASSDPSAPSAQPEASGGAPAQELATAQTAAVATPGWVLHGAGWGHGIGMSQYGAWEMAKDGYTAAQILGHYYTGTTYDAVTDNQLISVNLLASVGTATLTSSALVSGGGAFRLNVTGTASSMTGAAGGQVSVTRSGSSVVASCSTCTPVTSLTGAKISLVWDTLAPDKTLMKLGSTSYRDGTMYFTPASSGINVVDVVRLHDEYLDYIRESPWSWHVEALKAQAAAARGYALSKYANGIRSACNCHVYDTTADQVYGGYPSSGDLTYWPNWRNAVRASGASTTGYVARYNQKIIEAFFSSSSGGRTENNEDVWQSGTPLPYLRGVSDPWSLRPSNPNRSWTQTTVGSSMAAVFGLPDVVRLDLRDRTVNGGVHNATATSSTGDTKTITGDRLRAIATTDPSPYGQLKSTMIRHLSGRIAGANRYAVATGVAQRIPVTATTAVLASGESAAIFDASVSGPLSSAVSGPLLLTGRDELPSATLTELNRRQASLKTVYVVGGAASVSAAVVKQLTDRGLTVTRIAGANRYEVAANVAERIKAIRGTVSQVFVASGTAIADALGASGPAAALYYPILLTTADTLPAATIAALDSTGATWARIVGGTASVSPAVEQALVDRGLVVRRHGGADRYAVAAKVATDFRAALPSSEIVMTSGSDAAMADSLAAGSLRLRMVLSAPTAVPVVTLDVMQRTPTLERVTVVGGTASVSDAALRQAANS